MDKLPRASVIIVTIEAEARKFENEEDRSDLMWNDIRDAVGDYLPELLEDKWLEADEFPAFVADVLRDAMREMASRRMVGLRFIPVFNYFYRDGARMVTIGGMIGGQAEIEFVQGLTDAHGKFYTGNRPCRIAAPPLTAKEKSALDKMLPKGVAMTAKKLGFLLDEGQIEQYEKFYRQYPVFWELSP